MTANANITVYSFDSYGKNELTKFSYEIVKTTGNVTLSKGDSTEQISAFSASHPRVYCDIISIDGAHHAHFPQTDLMNFKYLANYPNIVLIDDYHEKDWPAVYNGVAHHIQEDSLKLRHVGKSSIIFRDKQKQQWAIAEYELLTIICATKSKDRLPSLLKIIATASAHPVVQHFIIIWNGPNIPNEVAALAHHPEGNARITVIQRLTNSLNNRYDPSLPIHTGAVMVVDDDLEISAETIACALKAWNQDPLRLYSNGEGRAISEEGYTWPEVGNAKTNFLLPRMVSHKKFLSVYFEEENKKVRDYVDTQSAHCDIAFAILISTSQLRRMKSIW